MPWAMGLCSRLSGAGSLVLPARPCRGAAPSPGPRSVPHPAPPPLPPPPADNRCTIDLPPPALIKPVELWTGKQLFGLLLRPRADVKVFVNLETAEKVYTQQARPGGGGVQPCLRSALGPLERLGVPGRRGCR